MTWPDGQTYQGEWRNGKMVGHGKHDSLLKESELYTNLFKSQIEKKYDE